MALLSGVGVRKLELYGEQFLAVILAHTAEYKTPDTVSESIELFRLGFNVQQVALKRELKEDTIYTHLAHGLEQGVLKLNEVLNLPEVELRTIQAVILGLPEDQQNALKPVYEQLDGQYSYGLLRCVRAALQSET